MISTANGRPSANGLDDGIWGVDPGDLSRIGVVSILVGMVALVLPGVVTIAVQLLIGLALIVSGGFELTHALPLRRGRGAIWHLALGGVSLAAGILFITSPMIGALTLTMIVGVMFTLSGLIKTAFALALRKLEGWHWTLGSGLMTLVVGLMILFLLPVVSSWLLGVLVGFEFLLNGAWMLYLGRGKVRITA